MTIHDSVAKRRRGYNTRSPNIMSYPRMPVATPTIHGRLDTKEPLPMRQQGSMLGLILLSAITISPQYVFGQPGQPAYEWETITKSLLIGISLISIYIYGSNQVLLWMPLALILFGLFQTFFLGADSALDMVKSVVGISTPWICACIKFDEKTHRQLIAYLARLPVICVCLGLLLHFANIYDLFRDEYTGVPRLQGAMIPAHLAFLGVSGSLACLLGIRTNIKKSFVFLVINTIIVLLTSTRTPSVISCFILLCGIIDIFRTSTWKSRTASTVSLLFVVSIFVLVMSVFVPRILERTFSGEQGNEVAGGVDASGRGEAWAFYVAKGMENPLYGSGIGSVTNMNQGDLANGFKTPHNEFIRYFCDVGLIGTLILLLLFIGVLIKLHPSKNRDLFYIATITLLVYSLTDNPTTTLQFSYPFLLLISSPLLRECPSRQQTIPRARK